MPVVILVGLQGGVVGEGGRAGEIGIDYAIGATQNTGRGLGRASSMNW